jgi:hypothetical protein
MNHTEVSNMQIRSNEHEFKVTEKEPGIIFCDAHGQNPVCTPTDCLTSSELNVEASWLSFRPPQDNSEYL